MAAPPLTHHDMLAIVEPFARRGRHLDLAASQRGQRRLVFKPVHRDAVTPGIPALTETLTLACYTADAFHLTRVLSAPDGMRAVVDAEGSDPGELLARVDAVDPAQQFVSEPGWTMAWSHRAEPAAYAAPAAASAATPDAATRPPPRLVLSQGVAQLDGLTLSLTLPAVRGIPADIELTPASGHALQLPEDLLAVLGWNWARLVQASDGWSSKARLRGREPARSRRAELRLRLAARHLATTLAEPPARFHERHVGARWGVFFRRAIPLLTLIALVAGAVALPYLGVSQDFAVRTIIFHSPPVLLALGFCLQELPRFEIPPWPRRSTAATWQDPSATPPVASPTSAVAQWQSGS